MPNTHLYEEINSVLAGKISTNKFTKDITNQEHAATNENSHHKTLRETIKDVLASKGSSILLEGEVL